jgi:hypothetical protein
VVLEAHEGRRRKVPQVKRLVMKGAPEGITRPAMLMRGEAAVPSSPDGTVAEEVKDDPRLTPGGDEARLHLLARVRRSVGPQVGGGRQARAPGGEVRPRPASHRRGRLFGLLAAGRLLIPRVMAYAPPVRTAAVRSKRAPAEAGYPHGFAAGQLVPIPPSSWLPKRWSTI